MLYFTRNLTKLNIQTNPVLVQEFLMAMKTLKKLDNWRTPVLIKGLYMRNLKKLNNQQISCQNRANQALVKGLPMKNQMEK